MNQPTLIITGATGFIGRYLVQEGIRRNFKVVALTRSLAKAKGLKEMGAKVIEINLSNLDKLEKLLIAVQPDYFIHNAGVTKLTMNTNGDYYRGNVDLTQGIVTALQNKVPNLKKLIFTSSLEAGGPGDAKSLRPKKISEPTEPITEYGKSKLLAEKCLQNQSAIPYIVLRPTAVYGSGDQGLTPYFNLVKAHIQPFFVSDKQLVSFIYVKDLVRLYYDALVSPVRGKVYFVSDGQVYTVNEFSNLVKKILDVWTIKVVIPKIILSGIATLSEGLFQTLGAKNFFSKERLLQVSELNWSCDISDTVQDFGFKPAYDLEKGLRETII